MLKSIQDLTADPEHAERKRNYFNGINMLNSYHLIKTINTINGYHGYSTYYTVCPGLLVQHTFTTFKTSFYIDVK